MGYALGDTENPGFPNICVAAVGRTSGGMSPSLTQILDDS